jgi:twinkle protein
MGDSTFLKHIPCDDCGSSDANGLYSDGHTYCHKCYAYTPAPEALEGSTIVSTGSDYATHAPASSKPIEEPLGAFLSIPDRGITKATCEFFGVRQSNTQHFYPYGAGLKVRTVEDKTFRWHTKDDSVPLFGMDKFNSGGKAVTIVEGELDALAAFQMMGSKYPVCSVRNGAGGALKDCQKAYEWLDSFETIVVCFDNDEPGLKASAEIAELFSGKAKVFKHSSGYKDACDYCAVDESALFVKQWWASERYVPDGIVTGASLHDLVMQDLAQSSAMYPFNGLNALTGGIRRQEMVVVTAGSGLGKSQFLREVIWELLTTTSDNIGLMFLEESVRRTGLSLMSLAANKPLHLAETEATLDEKEKAYALTLGTERLFLYDSFGSNSIDNIVNRVRYMAKGLECKYIFVDHISIIVSDQQHGDERKAIDEIVTKLRMIVQETGITLFAVSHLKRPDGKGHEDGAATSLSQLRGSGSIGQLSDMVIGLERNAQSDDPIERNTTKVRVVKNRYNGETGPACSVLYDKHTGRMFEVIDTL